MKGRILISIEGINGTLSCSTQEEMKEYIETMEKFDLIGELGLPAASELEVMPKAGKGRLFANIDWKISTTTNTSIDPFPDLKIQIVKEIVNTGGAINVDEIPLDTGKEISAEEFHNILLQAQESNSVSMVAAGDADVKEEDQPPLKKQKLIRSKEIVLIDVRNTFEHAIGHFIHPTSDRVKLLDNKNCKSDESKDDKDNDKGDASNIKAAAITTTAAATTLTDSSTPAINPNTVTFSHFNSTFCSQYSESLKDKKVLMYCTGGIRCVKASAMLKQRGVEDVSHLSGGIHRYLEKYGENGFYKGKVFVFDQRVALDVDQLRGEEQQHQQKDVVGKCIECYRPYDEISGANLCAVCRDLILICPSCRNRLHEFHCDRHQSWKHAYFTFLERFTSDELQTQKEKLQLLHDYSYLPAAKHKNVRKTLRKQMEKIDARLNDLKEGNAIVEQNARRRCRTCFESDNICDGRCWGFWKHSQSPQEQSGNGMTLMPIMEVKVGDRVTVGPNWNEIRLGSRGSEEDPRLGTVVDIKSWASGGDDLDCVAVKWDKSHDCSRRRNSSGTEAKVEIYRWGVVARNGQRMYDVSRLITRDGESSAR